MMGMSRVAAKRTISANEMRIARAVTNLPDQLKIGSARANNNNAV